MKWTKGSVPPLGGPTKEDTFITWDSKTSNPVEDIKAYAAAVKAGMWQSTRPAVTLDDLPDLLRSLGVVVTMDEDLGLVALLRPPEPEENLDTPRPRGNLRRC